jgi:VanZ family protein
MSHEQLLHYDYTRFNRSEPLPAPKLMRIAAKYFLFIMKRKTLSWILIAFWCGVIFYMSSRNGSDSSNMSMFLVHALERLIIALFGRLIFPVPEQLVRKAAHVFEYLVLGILLLSGFFSEKTPRRSIIYALLAGALYAISDETHQIFIPGRTASPFDVGIDTVGVMAGITTCFWWLKR